MTSFPPTFGARAGARPHRPPKKKGRIPGRRDDQTGDSQNGGIPPTTASMVLALSASFIQTTETSETGMTISDFVHNTKFFHRVEGIGSKVNPLAA